MIKEFMQWLHGFKSENKVISLSVLMLLIIVLEIYVPSFEWKILIDALSDWLTDNFSFLWRLFFWGAVLLVLYGFFLHKKLPVFLKKSIPEEFRHDRFILVLLVGAVEGALLFYYADNLINYFKKIDSPAWLGTLFTMLVAAPIALFIWSFRNGDKRQDLKQTQENLRHTEENIRQAGFHKIEEWATTFPTVTTQESESADSSEPEATTENTNPAKLVSGETKQGALQVAAIYQLLPYLKGDYGERFVRPSMEIYRSLLSSWEWNKSDYNLAMVEENLRIVKPSYIVALHTIFHQEYDFFCKLDALSICKENNWIPLYNIDLKCAFFSYAELKNVKLINANLIRAKLIRANLTSADLVGACLIRADLTEAILKNAVLFNANLTNVHLQGADLTNVHLRGANLEGAHLQEANLEGAHLNGFKKFFKGANFTNAHLQGANLKGAHFKGIKATFKGANLTGATYDEEDIKETIMDETTILTDGSHWKSPGG